MVDLLPLVIAGNGEIGSMTNQRTPQPDRTGKMIRRIFFVPTTNTLRLTNTKEEEMDICELSKKKGWWIDVPEACYKELAGYPDPIIILSCDSKGRLPTTISKWYDAQYETINQLYEEIQSYKGRIISMQETIDFLSKDIMNLIANLSIIIKYTQGKVEVKEEKEKEKGEEDENV